jgi:hypothetical protein
VIGNDGWEHAVGDVFGVHDYAGSSEVLRERYADRQAIMRTLREVRPYHFPLLSEGGEIGDEPIVLSEFGGLSFVPQTSEDWFGYRQFASADELLLHYEGLVDALLGSTALAGFCYTQLTDTEQEANGLATADREPKVDPERLRRINTRPSKAVPSEVLDAMIKEEVEQRRRERGQE